MANILESLTQVLQKSLAGDPPPPPILLPIGDRLAVLGAVSVDPSGEGIARWLATLRTITNDTRLHETLVVRALQMSFPRLAEALTLLGVISFQWEGAQPAAFAINWAALQDLLTEPGDYALNLLLNKVQKLDDVKALQALTLLLLSSPQALLTLEYSQEGFAALPVAGEPGVTLDQLIDLINSPLRLPLPFTLPLTLEEFKTQAGPAAEGAIGYLALNGPDAFAQLNELGVEVGIKAAESLKARSVDLGNGWQLTFTSSATGLQRVQIKFSATGIDGAAPSDGDFGIFLRKQPANANALLIGEPAGTHFAIQTVALGLRLHSGAPRFDLALQLAKVQFALKPDFLKFLNFGLNLPTQLKFASDVEMRYVQGQGLTGQGSADGLPALGVQFATPLNLKIGGSGAGLNLDTVVTRLEIAPKEGGLHLRALFRYGANAQLGPLRAAMDGAGVWFGRWQGDNGGLLPPQGIGLELDAGPVKGGGFLNLISDNEFAGALQLKVLGIGAFAYGIYQALPGGDPAFVALIGIRLPLPGIQLGFGFAVSGFGGLVGINRRADTDLLRERLTSGAAGDVLFNDDPMRNAPKLLGDMREFFPVEKGVFLIGPTLQINWLALLKLDVGVFIELPGPRKIFIAGSARLVIGSEDVALVYLRMDFIGGIDFTKSLIFFDAALVNSHVLGIFRITGGVALRIAYGVNGYFLFTVGGFHPAFNPGAMELPRVARVGVSVSLGVVWLKQEMYLALTSNTFQLGSRTEAGIEIGPISAHGWFGFDALIQFKPFYFIARVDAGFDVEVFGVSLCSVRVEGQLSGPGPLVLAARASVRILFVKVSANVTIELSSNPKEQIAPIPNLPQYLQPELRKGELSKPENLRIEGEDRSVIFAPHARESNLLAPVGELIWEQKRVPLNLAIEKAEGIDLGSRHTLTVSSNLGGVPEDDWFGVGSFLKLNDSEALNNSRFVKQQSGLRLRAGMLSDVTGTETPIQIDLVKLPQRSRFRDLVVRLYVNGALNNVLAERAGGAKIVSNQAGVSVSQEAWHTHDHTGQRTSATALNSVQAFVQAQQSGGLALPATEQALDLTGVF